MTGKQQEKCQFSFYSFSPPGYTPLERRVESASLGLVMEHDRSI